MARKQIINPLVGFGQRAIGPYANRIGQSTYARNVNLGEVSPSFIGFSAGSDGVIRALRLGSGAVTFARSTEAAIVDFEGLVKKAIVNEIRFERSRRVENVVNPVPTTSGTATLETIDAANQVYRLNGLDATQNQRALYRTEDVTTVIEGRTFQNRISIKGEGANIGRKVLIIFRRFSGGASIQSSKEFTLTGEFQDVSTGEVTAITGNIGFNIRISGADDNNATSVVMKAAQIEEVTGQSIQVPSKYVSIGIVSSDQYHGVNVDGVKCFAYENGNTVDVNGIITEAKGASITDYRALFEPASINRILSPVDFTTGAGNWTTSGACQTASTTIASPVQAVDWWRLEATTTTAGERYIFSNTYTKPAAAEEWVGSIVVKADQLGWIRLQIQNVAENKFVRAFFNLSTGTVGSTGNATWTLRGAYIEALKDGSYRCEVRGTTDTDTGINLRINLATGDNVTFITPGAVGDGVFIQAAQDEQQKAMTSFMDTGNTTRVADDPSPTFDNTGNVNVDNTKGTYVVDMIAADGLGDLSSTDQMITGLRDISDASIHFQDNIGQKSWDGVTSAFNATSWAVGDNYRVAIYWEAGVTNGWRIGFKNGGSYTWSSEFTMDADGFQNEGFISIGRTLQVPIRLRDLTFWKDSKGQQWIEDRL